MNEMGNVSMRQQLNQKAETAKDRQWVLTQQENPGGLLLLAPKQSMY